MVQIKMKEKQKLFESGEIKEKKYCEYENNLMECLRKVEIFVDELEGKGKNKQN